MLKDKREKTAKNIQRAARRIVLNEKALRRERQRETNLLRRGIIE